MASVPAAWTPPWPGGLGLSSPLARSSPALCWAIAATWTPVPLLCRVSQHLESQGQAESEL